MSEAQFFFGGDVMIQHPKNHGPVEAQEWNQRRKKKTTTKKKGVGGGWEKKGGWKKGGGGTLMPTLDHPHFTL